MTAGPSGSTATFSGPFLALLLVAGAAPAAAAEPFITLAQASGGQTTETAAPLPRIPPRPPRRVALEAPSVAPTAPRAVATRPPDAEASSPLVEALPQAVETQPIGLPPAPQPILPPNELAASSALVEGLADYVQAPTDPLTGLDFGAVGSTDVAVAEGAEGTADDGGSAGVGAIEVMPLSPLAPQPVPAPAVEPEQLAVAPPAGAALPGEGREAGAATRNLGGVLQDMMDPESVVARVNGETILWRSIVESAESLPEDYQGKLESIFPALLQRLVDLKLLAQRARDSGLDQRADVRRKVAAFEEVLLREALLREMLARELSDDALRAAYDDYGAEAKTHMQVKARHILLDSKEEALEVIAALDAGADFAKLARERSQGSSAGRGGDLGWVDVARMVPPFGAALAGQPIGRHGVWPVESQFGWHVVLVEDRQGEQVPPFEQVLPQLRQVLGRDLIERRLVDLRERADIEIVEPAPADVDAAGRPESE